MRIFLLQHKAEVKKTFIEHSDLDEQVYAHMFAFAFETQGKRIT